jgi:hypothetical protein
MVDDLHRKDGDGLAAALAELPELGSATDPLTPLKSLDPDDNIDAIGEALREFARRMDGDQLSYALLREKAFEALKQINALSSPARLIDAAIAEASSNTDIVSGSGLAGFLKEPEPWPTPVIGSEVLQEIVTALSKYMVLLDSADVAVAL